MLLVAAAPAETIRAEEKIRRWHMVKLLCYLRKRVCAPRNTHASPDTFCLRCCLPNSDRAKSSGSNSASGSFNSHGTPLDKTMLCMIP